MDMNFPHRPGATGGELPEADYGALVSGALARQAMARTCRALMGVAEPLPEPDRDMGERIRIFAGVASARPRGAFHPELAETLAASVNAPFTLAVQPFSKSASYEVEGQMIEPLPAAAERIKSGSDKND